MVDVTVTGPDWLPPARIAPPWTVGGSLPVPASQWLAWLRENYPAFSFSIFPATADQGETWTCTSVGGKPFTASRATAIELLAELERAGYEPRPAERARVTRMRRSS
jgi:hypothetical protein